MIEVEAGTLHRTRQRRRLGVFGAVLALLLLAAGTVALTRAIMYRDAVLPGVAVAGLDVGSLERSHARARIEAVLGARLRNP